MTRQRTKQHAPVATQIEIARANLERLEARRIAALDGAGRSPDPAVIEAAREAFRAAKAKAARLGR
jgi:hypothetical protein